jgi:hypothetical protein
MSGQAEEGTIAKLTLLQAGDNHRDVTSRSGGDRAVDLGAPDARYTSIPNEFEPSVPRAFEVFEANRMLGATPEIYCRHSPSERDLSPVVDHELVVDPEAVAVVAFDADLTDVAARGRCDGARPTRRIPVERNAARRRVQRPSEVDPLVDAHDTWLALEAVVVEVLAAETALRFAARCGHEDSLKE